MTTMVVGGAGFIGPLVIQKLVARGEKVVCLDINPRAVDFSALGDAVKVVFGDVTRGEDVLRAVMESKADRLLNLAYRVGGGDTEPHLAVRLNILGMDNCFEAARFCGVRRTVYASSLAVYGRQKHYGERPVTEEDACYPEGVYAVCKLFNESQAEWYMKNYGMNIIGIRVANVTGPLKTHGSMDHVRCVREPALGKHVRFPNKGTMHLPIYVEDIAEAFARITLADSNRYHIYNSGGYTVSISELADLVREFLPEAQITFDKEGGRTESRSIYMMDSKRILEEFEFSLPPIRQRVLDLMNEVRRTEGLPAVRAR